MQSLINASKTRKLREGYKNNTQIVVVIMMMTKIIVMQILTIWNKEKILIIKKSYKKVLSLKKKSSINDS